MKRRATHILSGLAAVGAVVMVILSLPIDKGVGPWRRDDPLTGSIAVERVEAGRLVLVNGRVVAPAGIRRKVDVPVEEFDRALAVASAQGVRLDGEVANGSALMIVEPKFYDWCGNCRRRSAGFYQQASLSELLIAAEYAEFDQDQTGLSEVQLRRLRATQAQTPGFGPAPISDASRAFRRGVEAWLCNSDEHADLILDSEPRPK